MQTIGKLLAITALVAYLPLLASAAEPGGDAAGGVEDAATRTQQKGSPETSADAGETRPEGADPEARLEAYPGVVQKVMADGMVVRRAGRASDPRAPAYMAFVGKLGVPVEGQGKSSWLALRRGDVVMVSYVTGPPHRAVKVNVLPRPQPMGAQAAVRVNRNPTPPKSRQRSFIGYIKQKDGDELIVMSPPAAPPGRRPAEVKAFIRTEDTRVDVLRDSWEELRKGDRVRIGHQKGNPRPIDVVQVIRRGGEEPLPPGLATRLFDPRYDESVEDVDGIGETGPVPTPPRRPGGGIRLRRGGGK